MGTGRQMWCTMILKELSTKYLTAGAAPRGALGGLEPPRRGGLAPPSGNLGIFVGGVLSVCTANVRVQISPVAFTVQIPQRCEITELNTHGWI